MNLHQTCIMYVKYLMGACIWLHLVTAILSSTTKLRKRTNKSERVLQRVKGVICDIYIVMESPLFV